MSNQIDLQIRRMFVILQKLREQKYVWRKFLKRTSGVLYIYYLELREKVDILVIEEYIIDL